MKSKCDELIQTPGICNGIQTEYCMKQISYAQFFDFVETLNRDLKKIQPLYEEDPQQFDGYLSIERLGSLLETFDSFIDFFSNILDTDTLYSSKNESSVISSVFATMFTNYMQMTADLLSHDFPIYSILPFIGVYANLQKIYIDILRCVQNDTEYLKRNTNISRFKSAWDRHYFIFSNLPILIKYLDFPIFSQKLENIYQYTKNFNPEDSSQQQLFMMINNLSYLLKSMKEKLLIMNEKTTKQQIQDLLNETSTFQEYIQSIGQNQLNGFHMSIYYSLVTNLEIAKSILNIADYLERLNKIVQQENFTIDITDFATLDVQLIIVKHIMQTMVSELNCLIHFSQKPPPISTKRIAQSLYQAIKNDSIDLSEKYEKLVEAITPLLPQSDVEYENVFISTMSNIRSPETIFESFKNTMKKLPKTIEDHCSRLTSFVEFENAANLNINQSNDIIKFKEYLVYNIIAVKIQEIIPILEDQILRVEGNLYHLSNKSKMGQISSCCKSIILHLHQMIARKTAPKKVRLFAKFFVLFMEFTSLIIKRGLEHHSFIQLTQNIPFPPPDLIFRSFRNPSEMSKLRLLISKIQMCQLSITKTTSIIFDKFANSKGNEENCIQIDQANGQYILDKKDIFSHQVGIFDRCDEYIRDLFLLLYNFKSFSSFYSIYCRFYEIIGQSANSFKVMQKLSTVVSPVLVKNIPIFVRSLIKLLKVDRNNEPFLIINSSLFDLYSTVLSFLKSAYMNESIDGSVLFLHILDSIPMLNFSRSLSEFILNMNRIEVILLSSKSSENLRDSIIDFRNCFSSIFKSIILNKNFDVAQINNKIDTFLAGLFYLSPKVFAKVEDIFCSVVYFLKQLDSVKSFIESVSQLTAEFKLSSQTFSIKYSDIILRNFILSCSKVIKKINKSEFLSLEISDYLSGFSNMISNSLPKHLFDKVDDFHLSSIFQAFMNLFTSSVSFYQSSSFPLSISSLLPPPPPVTFLPSSFTLPHQSPLQSSTISSSSSNSNLASNSNLIDSNAEQPHSALSLPSLPLYSLWFMNNFDFIQKVQPLLINLTSIVSNSDEGPENMSILIKMNEIVRNLDRFLKSGRPDDSNGNENENGNGENDDEDELEILAPAEKVELSKLSEIVCSNLYLSKFSLVYKLKKLLKKINFQAEISQCQFIDCYCKLESMIDTEMNILHLNRLLMFSNFILYEKLQTNFHIIKGFKFTKCTKLVYDLKKSSKSAKSCNPNKVLTVKLTNNDDYDDYDESEKSDETQEAADYEEEVDETEPGETKEKEKKKDEIETETEEKEKSEEKDTEQEKQDDDDKTEEEETKDDEPTRAIPKKENDKKQDSDSDKENENDDNENENDGDRDDGDDEEADYEEDHEDTENRKEEEDQEYGEEHEYGDYDYDDYSELRMRSSISSNFKRGSFGGFSSSINNNNNENIESILYSNNGNKNFFDFDFARKVELDDHYIDLIKKGKTKFEREPESNENDADFYNDSFASFPYFYPSGVSVFNKGVKNIIGNTETGGDGEDEVESDQPVRFQLEQLLENSELMLNEIRKLIETSSLWMHGSSRDALIPLIPLSDAVSDVNRELHSTIESIYQKISLFDTSNGEVIEEAKKWLEKSAARHGTVRNKQKELLSKVKEFTRSKNVLSYTYSISVKKYEKLKSENLKKKIELHKLNSKLRLAQMLNNIHENDSEGLSKSGLNESKKGFDFKSLTNVDDDIDNGDDDYENESDSEMNEESIIHRSDTNDSLNDFSQLGQNFVIEPFVPVRIVSNIGAAPADSDEANKALSNEILENERLKSLLRASNAILKNQRMYHKLNSNNNSNSVNNNNNENDENTIINHSNSNDDLEVGEDSQKDVVDQYFGQIALIKSFSEKLEKPISSEVDVNEAGEELIKAISEFRKNSTESRQAYREATNELLRKLDKMISIYRIQKDRTNKVRSLIRAAKVTKEDYKTALSDLLNDDKLLL